jgi:hypothetical protein
MGHSTNWHTKRAQPSKSGILKESGGIASLIFSLFVIYPRSPLSKGFFFYLKQKGQLYELAHTGTTAHKKWYSNEVDGDGSHHQTKRMSEMV